MPKWMLLASRPPGADRESFLRHQRDALARQAARPDVARVVAHFAEPDDALLAAQQGRAARPQRVDAVVALWLEAGTAPAELPDAARGRGAAAHAIAVDEVVHWDYARDWPDGEPSPGPKLLYFVCKRPELSRDAFVTRYRDGHAPLARVHHPGIWRYAQNFVRPEPGPPCGGAPRWDAISELHFRSEQDLRERFYRDASSPGAIAEDVARFLDLTRGFALVTREVIVKSQSGSRVASDA